MVLMLQVQFRVSPDVMILSHWGWITQSKRNVHTSNTKASLVRTHNGAFSIPTWRTNLSHPSCLVAFALKGFTRVKYNCKCKRQRKRKKPQSFYFLACVDACVCVWDDGTGNVSCFLLLQRLHLRHHSCEQQNHLKRKSFLNLWIFYYSKAFCILDRYYIG